MSETIRQIRLQKLQNLYDKKINPYPLKFERTHTCAAAGKLKEGEKNIKVAGRLIFARKFGKLIFWKIRDKSGNFQVILKQDEIGAEQFKFWLKNSDIGDFFGIIGEIAKTKTGEVSLLSREITILSKSLQPLPEKWHGLKDEDERFRKRYLDFLLNPESREKVLIVPKIAQLTREFLNQRDFSEVQTPVLENNSSGATANPFQTHIKAFDEDVFLRICMGELWQKKMLIGAFEKTFEIGKAFRNEGVDRDHNPEFTMCEYYWAYADRDDNIQMFEELILFLIDKIKGTRQFIYKEREIDFTPPFKKATFRELILKETKIDIDKFSDAQSLKKEALAKIYSTEIEAENDYMLILDQIWKQAVRPQIWHPTFVLDYPTAMKPLAKMHPSDPSKSHCFQLVVDGAEICNSYSEINNPLDQAARFAEQNELENQEEAMGADAEFVEALEYGMPPASGLGFGLDRLAMILTNAKSLRETTTFPFMKRGKKGASLTVDNL